jgi:hypothetical protein
MEEAPKISHGEFLRLYPVRAPHLMWFLGAGASAGAGIPTAWDMIWEFKRLIYCTETHISLTRCANLSDERLRRRIQKYFDDQAPGQYPTENDPREYETYFQKAYPHESDRRSYIDSAVTRGGESFGQLCLAGLLRCNRANIVWTTNFDHLLEDACAKVYGTTKSLTHANLDNPQVAISAINQCRWPILVKLHGDFRSDRLKNIRPELENQDAQLRRVLVTSSKTNGLIIAGYSGRDPSVMNALTEALSDGPGFPQGLFWLSRRGNPVLESVTTLLKGAVAKGVQAAVIEIENFDELMAELITTDTKIDEPTKKVILPNRKHLTQLPMPSIAGSYPVIRTNALPIGSYPSTCRRIDCTIGNTKEVREAIEAAEADVLAVRSKEGVLAFGDDAEVKRVFEPFDIKDYTIHSFAKEHLEGPGTQRGLLYDAIVRALARELPLRRIRRGSQHFLVVGGKLAEEPKLQPLVKAAKQIFGNIPHTSFSWAEAVAVRLESTPNQLWLLLEPTVLGSKPNDTHTASDRQRRKDYLRERQATRYNKQWNNLLKAWIDLLSGEREKWSVKTFGLTEGVDATFEISSTTGFSRRYCG